MQRSFDDCLVDHMSHAYQKHLSRLRRWSVELGSLAALQLLIACCSLCVLLLYMRLDPDKKKFVWNRIGQFSACVTANLALCATATLASMNNQIWCVRCCQSALFVTPLFRYYQANAAMTSASAYDMLAVAIYWSMVNTVTQIFANLFRCRLSLAALVRLLIAYAHALEPSIAFKLLVLHRLFDFRSSISRVARYISLTCETGFILHATYASSYT